MAGNYTYDPAKKIFCGSDDDGNAILVQGDRAFNFLEAVENQGVIPIIADKIDTMVSDIENLHCIKADIAYVDETASYCSSEPYIASIARNVVKEYFLDLIKKRRDQKLNTATITESELFELLDTLNITTEDIQ